jgi:GrpB-like predicted nucleotidyltransferase (UPF0157 family)
MDEIIIVDYDPRWPVLFMEEANRVKAALGGMIVGIEHIGSTAVPRLDAKPIIDMLIGVDSIDQAREHAVPILEGMGYSFWVDNPRKDVLFLVKGLPPNGPRTHHIHIETMDEDWADRLAFRDYLRAHPDEARQYASLKRRLASEFEMDREAYTAAKTEYIREITARAKAKSD